MRTKTKDVPYTAEGKICQSVTGEQIIGVEIRVKAPSRIVAMLDERGTGHHRVQSASLEEITGADPLLDVPKRAQNWKSRRLLLEAIHDDLDDEIRLLISLRQWHAIGTLCGKLGITPGQWYLSSAAYNAGITEANIDKMLESIPAIA